MYILSGNPGEIYVLIYNFLFLYGLVCFVSNLVEHMGHYKRVPAMWLCRVVGCSLCLYIIDLFD